MEKPSPMSAAIPAPATSAPPPTAAQVHAGFWPSVSEPPLPRPVVFTAGAGAAPWS